MNDKSEPRGILEGGVRKVVVIGGGTGSYNVLSGLRRDDRLKHGLVLQERIDTPEIGGPQFLDVGKHHFPQTPLSLLTTDHASSAVSSDLPPPARLRPHTRPPSSG